MLFSSTIFLWFFLPLTIIGNYLIKPKYSNILLLAASLIFYAWGEPICVLIMLASIVLNWGFGLLIHHSQASKRKKFLLVVCVILNLLILGYFKYLNFFADTINQVLQANVLTIPNIVMPIGISFFTFQALSYVVDLYRGECEVQKNVLHLALYISFFPQLIAGPIVRYHDIDQQICERTVTKEKFAYGMRRFLYGLGKKVIISNCAAELADKIFGLPSSELTTATAWVGAIAYTIQIYYDFSGYSDMAIGLGRIFGFDFLENFNYPYLSRSVQEFWQRWHISLGTWFKEYVYIPLGGNRKGNLRTYLNLITVFFLTGMWHGASWHFIIWGLYHGFFQILERLGLKKILAKCRVVSHIYCILIFVFGWVLFRADSLTDSVRYILHMVAPWICENMFTLTTSVDIRTWSILLLAILGCGPLQLIGEKIPVISKKWKFSLCELLFLCGIFVYCLILLTASTYNPFIYFRF